MEYLATFAEMIRLELGDNDLQGKNQGSAGWIDYPQYMILKK